MTNSIDEKNLLVFDPNSASIIFTVGEGLLTKSKKIVASLTQALILFSDKVVNQEISFIRFQNHRMVFIHEQGLFGVKLVPKDQLTKNFVPAIKIILNIENQLRNLDSSIQELAEPSLRTFYELISNPEQNIFIFPESIEGYLSLLTMMAGLNYDLSINLETIKNNFLILKEDSLSKLREQNLDNYKGIFSFGLNVKDILDEKKRKSLVLVDLKDSIFNIVFPNNKSVYKLISQIIGTESSTYIISQIINREQSINEVALSLVKLPDPKMSVEIAIEAISNFSKEQKLAKPLYRIIIKKLKDLEGNFDIGMPEFSETQKAFNPVTQKIEVIKEERIAPETVVEEKTSEEVRVEEKPAETSPPVIFSSSELTSLANEFTTKLADLTKNEVNEVMSAQKITDEQKETEIGPTTTIDTSKLKIDKNHIFMEHFKIYLDFAPFRLGLNPETINYRPSIQVVRLNNEYSQIIVKISPSKHNWLQDIIKDLNRQVEFEYKGEEGVFDITLHNKNLNDVFRIAVWASIIEMVYSIQRGETELPEIFKISNKSNLCVILELTPERRRQLPSQIEEVIEEDKLLVGSGVEDLVKSIDNTLVAISDGLKTKKGVGFVLRKNSKELPLILEFVLTLSEICGIGWSRW